MEIELVAFERLEDLFHCVECQNAVRTLAHNEEVDSSGDLFSADYSLFAVTVVAVDLAVACIVDLVVADLFGRVEFSADSEEEFACALFDPA